MTDWTAKAGAALTWERIGQGDYECRAGGRPLARLRWRSVCGSLAVGECAEGRWSFKRMGFFRPRITVRGEGAETDLGVLQTTGRTTQLRLADGAVFTWSRVRPRHRRYAFVDASGGTVVEFACAGWSSASAAVITGATATPPGTLALLVLTGWYRLVLEQMDEDTAMTATTIAALNTAVMS